MNIRNGLILISLFALVFTSCTKEDEGDEATLTFQSGKDNSMMESEFAAIYDVVEDIASGDTQVYKKSSTILPNGATVTFNDKSFTDGDGIDFCVDYGALGSSVPKGILCKDGRYRAGSFCVYIDQRFSMIGAEATISIAENNNYYSGDGDDMTKFIGEKTVLRLDDNKFQIVVNNAIAENPEFKIVWTANYVIDKIKDEPDGILGDEYAITGKANGTNRNGEKFEANITQGLLKRVQIGCASTFVDGVLTVDNIDKGTRFAVDYDATGGRECDKIVLIRYNGNTYQFIVR